MKDAYGVLGLNSLTLIIIAVIVFVLVIGAFFETNQYNNPLRAKKLTLLAMVPTLILAVTLATLPGDPYRVTIRVIGGLVLLALPPVVGLIPSASRYRPKARNSYPGR